MSIWDDRILEWIRENDSATPKELKESGRIHVSKSHISRRLQRLAEHGLLQNLARGVYVITEKGEAYLDEEYDAETDVYLDGSGGDVSVGDNTRTA